MTTADELAERAGEAVRRVTQYHMCTSPCRVAPCDFANRYATAAIAIVVEEAANAAREHGDAFSLNDKVVDDIVADIEALSPQVTP